MALNFSNTWKQFTEQRLSEKLKLFIYTSFNLNPIVDNLLTVSFRTNFGWDNLLGYKIHSSNREQTLTISVILRISGIRYFKTPIILSYVVNNNEDANTKRSTIPKFDAIKWTWTAHPYFHMTYIIWICTALKWHMYILAHIIGHKSEFAWCDVRKK